MFKITTPSTVMDGKKSHSYLSTVDEAKEIGDLSDGYHTFNELYEFRKAYNACLFNLWASLDLYDVHKSRKHNDGGECFGGGWFIVTCMTPFGQVSNHYPESDWSLFTCKEEDKSTTCYDGHTSKDVLFRLKATAMM